MECAARQGGALIFVRKKAHTVYMKKVRQLSVLLVCIATILSVCAFKIDEKSSIKDITHPYINTYECRTATLGQTDILCGYDYIRLIIGESNSLTLLTKPKNGEEYACFGTYAYDRTTGELTADIGVLGYKMKPTTKIERGRFTITMPVLNRQLIMSFEAM